jgi:hypothetical protein
MTARRIGCAVLVSSITMFLVPLASSAGDTVANGELARKIQALVDQLAASDAAKQTAAASALIKLGPDILPFLPGPDAKLTPIQRSRIQSIRATLHEAQLQKDLAPRLCTIQGDFRLKAALEELKKQTSLTVDDRRQGPNKDEDPLLKLDINKTTFWQAIDAIAKEADLRIAFYQSNSRVALIDGPFLAQPVCYHGLFRISVKRMVAVHDLESDQHFCNVTLEIAWEPRVHPLFLETDPEAITVQDDQGAALKALGQAGGRLAVTRPSAVEVQVRTEAPKRSSSKLGLLKGALDVISPSKTLDFTFENLAAAETAKGGPQLKETRDDVSVAIKDFVLDKDRWTIGLLLEYPSDSADFESFEAWLVNNELALEKKDGKERFPANGGYEIDDQSGHRAVIIYRFVEENDLVLGKPGDWKLTYRTPGRISKIPVQFEFKDLPLP